MTRDGGLLCSLYRIAQAVTKRIDVAFIPYVSRHLPLTVKCLSEVLNFRLRPTDRGIHSIRLHLICLNSIRFN